MPKLVWRMPDKDVIRRLFFLVEHEGQLYLDYIDAGGLTPEMVTDEELLEEFKVDWKREMLTSPFNTNGRWDHRYGQVLMDAAVQANIKRLPEEYQQRIQQQIALQSL